MKIAIVVLVNLLCIMLLLGCTVEKKELIISKYNEDAILNFEVISNGMIIDSENYSVCFKVKNNTGDDILFGAQWYLEVMREENWYTIDYNRDIVFPLKEYYTTPLPSGKYRIIQKVNSGLFSLEFNV